MRSPLNCARGDDLNAPRASNSVHPFSCLRKDNAMGSNNKHPRRRVRIGGKHQAENLSQTRLEHANEIAEDYVEAIADLVSETGEARVVDLAKRLGVTHVTVNRTIARLQKTGFVTSQPYRA